MPSAAKISPKKPAKTVKRIPSPNGAKFVVEEVQVGSLRPHPRNYREHPDDELEHLEYSLRRFGVYRNVVVAKDGTILAGHGVVQAAKRAGMETIPVIRLNLSPEDSEAIKILVGDNGIGHLAEQDDRLLSELLKQIKEMDADSLIGTGFDEMMLANLVMVTRPESEIADFNAAAEWVGMPDYERLLGPLKLIVSFHSEQDRQAFAKLLGCELSEKTKSIWYPLRDRRDLASVRFKG